MKHIMNAITFSVSLGLLMAVFVPEVAAQPAIHIHPGWLTTGDGFDVADGWDADRVCCWSPERLTEGTYTFGVNNPAGNPWGISDFWNASLVYQPSALWILNEGAYLQSTLAKEVTEEMPWLFVQFSFSDMNDGIAEIGVQKVGESEWLAVGSYDTFGRGNHWVSIEGLPQGSYYIRLTSRWNGRMSVAPNNACGHANNLIPARMGRTAATPPERLLLTGGGWLPVEGGKTTLGMNISFRGGDDRPSGHFTYVDHFFKGWVQSTEILGIEVVGDEAWIRLAALSNAGNNHTIYAHLQQGGEGADGIDINVGREWSSCTGDPWVYQQSLKLGGGQIKVH